MYGINNIDQIINELNEIVEKNSVEKEDNPIGNYVIN